MAEPLFEYKGILIEQDRNNWIVKVPMRGKKKPSKKYDIDYYGSLKTALEGVLEILLKRRLSQEVSHSVQELAEKIDSVKKELLQEVSLNLDREITIRRG